MAQIIQDDNGIGALLGSSLGTGLGSALHGVAQNKLQNLLQRQQAHRIAPGLAALGIPQEQAHQIAMLPEQLQSLVLKNYLQAAESAGLDQALGGLSGDQPQQQQQGQFPQELLQYAQQQGQPQQQKLGPQLTSQDANPQAQLKQQEAAPVESSKKPRNLQELLKSPRLSPEHRLKVAALQQQRQQHLEKLSVKEQQEVDKETKPYYDEISKLAKGAKEGEIRLDRMQELIHRGNLRGGFTSALVNALDKVGLDISSLEGADTQEFRKLSNDFIKNAKDFFGSRITDQDLKAFLKTIPNVSQSDEAKLRVISNLKSFNQIALLKKKAADEIISKNGGKRPRNLDQLVENTTSDQVDKIANDFKKRLDF